MASRKEPGAGPTMPKSQVLQVPQRPGVPPDRQMADVLTDGVVTNASAVIAFTKVTMPDTSLTELVNSLADQGKRVNSNDFAQQEAMLNAQANALNAIFGELCRRASLNMGEYMEATERYLRLAFKAQSQCRATVETLAAIKNPPLVYAKQANIAHGPQQVNNGGPEVSETVAPSCAQEEEAIEHSKLLALRGLPQANCNISGHPLPTELDKPTKKNTALRTFRHTTGAEVGKNGSSHQATGERHD